jgi:enoyl-CoA hydratase/carnithine racemase
MTIQRPEVSNALNPAANAQMATHWRAALADESVWVVVLTGAGERAFCAGADLGDQLIGQPGRDRIAFGGGLTGLGGPRLQFDKPIIAAVNGYAVGGGFELALSCDVIVASTAAKFGMPEARIGVIAESPPVHRAIRQLPHHVALELLLTGRSMDAAEARRWGLVHDIVEPSDLADRALRLAEDIARSSPLAVRAVLEAARSKADDSLDDALTSRFESVEAYLASVDYKEALAAIQARRPPQWLGR